MTVSNITCSVIFYLFFDFFSPVLKRMGPTFYRCIESMCRLVCWNHARLVVSFFNPSEKYDFVSWDDEIPNTSIAYGKTKNVPNHQPDVRVCVCWNYVCFILFPCMLMYVIQLYLYIWRWSSVPAATPVGSMCLPKCGMWSSVWQDTLHVGMRIIEV